MQESDLLDTYSQVYAQESFQNKRKEAVFQACIVIEETPMKCYNNITKKVSRYG